jgi:MGT family glycosyltransferase
MERGILRESQVLLQKNVQQLDPLERETMKVLFAATPVIGHVNPLLVAARVLKNAGHEVAFYTGTRFREKVENARLKFFPLPEDVDYDAWDMDAAFPERQHHAPGPDRLLFDMKHIMVDAMPSQYQGLKEALERFPADLVVHETIFCGILPLLLGPRSARPYSACLGISVLQLPREDGLPFGPGLPPAKDAGQREQYREIAQNVASSVADPVRAHANKLLRQLGVGLLTAPLFESIASLADVMLQPCVPGFEFPLRETPKNLHYIGLLMPDGSGDVPSRIQEAKDADQTIILVSQGTIANQDLGQLVAPVIHAFGDREDCLILVTTGGRPLDAIPCPLPPNTVASQHLDFSKVLPNVDVLVTFGGYGTVTQALNFGVPMVVAGQTEDKPENGARVAWTGTGLYLRTDNPTIHQVRGAVEYVLSEPKYREAALKMALEFRSFNAAREIRYVLGTLVAEGQAVPA